MTYEGVSDGALLGCMDGSFDGTALMVGPCEGISEISESVGAADGDSEQ